MIKACKIRLRKFDKSRAAIWEELQEQSQIAHNLFFRTWLHYHEDKGSPALLRQWRDELIQYHKAINKWNADKKKWDDAEKQWRVDMKNWRNADKATRGEPPERPNKAAKPKNADKPKKPKCPVHPYPPECKNRIYAVLANESGSSLHLDAISVLMQRTSNYLKTRKSDTGSFSWWVDILLGRAKLPEYSRPHPIYVNLKKHNLLRPVEGDDWGIRMRVQRLAPDSDGIRHSILDEAQLWTRGRKCSGIRTILRRITTGQYRYVGTKIMKKDGKWFAIIDYEMPPKKLPEKDPNKEAVLFPGRQCPWILLIDGKRHRWGGPGVHVGAMRKRTSLELKERQENYKWGNQNQRGHGRKRAIRAYTKLTNNWNNFCKNYNNNVARKIINKCQGSSISKLIFYQYTIAAGETRLLSSIGKQDGCYERPWPFERMAQRLKELCDEYQIEYEVRKVDHEPEQKEEKPQEQTGKQRKPEIDDYCRLCGADITVTSRQYLDGDMLCRNCRQCDSVLRIVDKQERTEKCLNK